MELPERLYDDAVALWHETGLTRPWNDPSADLRRAMEGCSSTVLCSLDPAGALVGTAMVGHDGHRGWVYYVAVRPSSQRGGIGRSLMLECEQWLRARDVPKLQLMVRRTNPSALGFYERLGYADADTVVMGRFL